MANQGDDGQGESCADIEAVATRHLAEVRDRQADLSTLETTLADMGERCRVGALPDCPIIESLYDAA